MFTCSNLNLVKFFLGFVVSLTSVMNIAQTKGTIDIDSKAKELGITKTDLQSILKSALRNGESVDPLEGAITEKFFTGQAAEDEFGFSVCTAGDVNGDGYSDVIVGAPLNDAGGNDAGRAYIYFGGRIMDNTADIIMTGETAGDDFGWSVCTAGDVNGDGYSDVIVGAYSNDVGGNQTGRAYIYFGGTSMDNTADIIMMGEAAGDNFGWSVSTAGDVNGDSYSDIIVGAPSNDAGGNLSGRAYIYNGGTSMDNTADVIVTGEAASDFFGYSVSTADDLNGDGYSDVIVGALFNNAGGIGAGRAYIYMGGTSMDNTADAIMTGEAAGDNFGCSVSTAGDLNGDGYGDLIVGSRYNDVGGIDAGSAYIYFGSASMDSTADVIMTGKAAGDNFGWSVSKAGDINGDGYSDVIVGAKLNDTGGTSAGRAYIYFGGASMDNTADVIMTGEAADDQLGASVSTAGDVNGDGYSDAIVGAPLNDTGGSSAGRAYLYLNSLTGLDIPDEFFTGVVVGDNFGFSVSTAGDVNGDGYRDIIVGAPLNDAGGDFAGTAYIYFGGISIDNTADVTMTGEAEGDNFGRSVSTAGDVNGDGYTDVIVGADSNSIAGINAGRSYIYFGGTSMDNTADVILTGELAGDRFGWSVSTAGDVNGDGYSDVITGAPFNDAGGGQAGRVYIYFGGASMDNTIDVILTGLSGNDNFGYSVSTTGDINGDGYSDVIVGAPFNDDGGNQAGNSYIFFGGLSVDNSADVIMTGEAQFNNFGYSVSTAGDVNGDGYSDAVVGAPSNDAVGIDAGRSYIFFGGLSVDNSADVIMNGEAAGDNFGFSVSTAGDANGDGYSDIIVGACLNDAGGIDAGRSYIFFGGLSVDNNADVIMTGEAAGDNLGWSVSTFGDLNLDGYSDAIVGAPLNDAGGNEAGRAYLFLSSSPPIKPRIMSINDVPFDQGGYVYVNFVRSGYDAIGETNIISEYIIEMSNPPGDNGFSWIQLGIVQPLQRPLYTFVAETPNDSITNNSGTYYFQVTARTSDPNQYWRSNIIYGHSVDNLAPLPVANFMSTLAGANPDIEVNLTWSPNTEADLKNYVLYRTNYPNADPDTLIPLMQLIDSTYVDTSPLAGTSYYYIRAQDIHNNLGEPVSDSVGVVSSVDVEVEIIPTEFALYQNYPNPFNPSTKIRYQLPQESKVIIKIYDILGADVMTLVSEKKEAGVYELGINLQHLPSGTYIYRIVADNFIGTKKMVLMK